jgi:hypothetical protein
MREFADLFAGRGHDRGVRVANVHVPIPPAKSIRTFPSTSVRSAPRALSAKMGVA